jgi:hypothetical protein
MIIALHHSIVASMMVIRPSRKIETVGTVLGVAMALLIQDAGWCAPASSQSEKAPSQLAEKPAETRTMPPSVQKNPLGPALYRILVDAEAKRAGLPSAIGEAVMAVESGYDPNALGSSGEIGLMQILPSTAHMLGFVGAISDLSAPETNIHYGITYLGQAWELANHDLCTAVMKYRAGHGETRFSYRSVDYCVAIRAKLAARGFPITGSVPVATFGKSSGCVRKGCFIDSHRFALGSRENPSPNLLVLNNRLNQIVINVNARRPPVP